MDRTTLALLEAIGCELRKVAEEEKGGRVHYGFEDDAEAVASRFGTWLVRNWKESEEEE